MNMLFPNYIGNSRHTLLIGGDKRAGNIVIPDWKRNQLNRQENFRMKWTLKIC